MTIPRLFFLFAVFPLGILSSSGQDAPPVAEAPVQLRAVLVPERSVYCPQSPVTLRLVIQNFGSEWIEVLLPKYAFAEMVRFEEGPRFKTPRSLLSPARSPKPGQKIAVAIPRGGPMRLDGGKSIVVTLPLGGCFSFEEPGDYSAVLKLPPLNVKVLGTKRVWNPTAHGAIKVMMVPGPEKTNATVQLIPADKAAHGVPTLKWTMKPPAREKLPPPNIYDGNCRIVIRNEHGQLVQEQFLVVQGAPRRGAEWTQPLEWELPLSMQTFGQVGNLFPRAGDYQIEASFRTYLPAGGTQTVGAEPGELVINDVYVSEKELQRRINKPDELRVASRETRGFREAKPSDSTPAEGRWIAFAKTFNLRISEEEWKKTGEPGPQHEVPAKLPPPPPIRK